MQSRAPGREYPPNPRAGTTDRAATANSPAERGSPAGAALPDPRGSGGPDPAAGKAPRTHRELRGARTAPSLQEGDAASENRDRPRGGRPRPRYPSARSPGPCAGRGGSSRNDVSRRGRPHRHGRREETGPGQAPRRNFVTAQVACVRGGERPSWSRAGKRPAPPAAAIFPPRGACRRRQSCPGLEAAGSR